MNTPTRWWIAGSDGRARGPLDAAAIQAELRERHINLDDRVCAEGGTTWQPLATVADLAPAAPPLGLGRLRSVPRPGGPFDVAELRAEDLRRVSAAACILLSFVTFGIWGVVEFYMASGRYRRLAAVASSAFEGLFWTWLSLMLASYLLEPLRLGAIAVGAMMLRESISLRDQTRRRIAPDAPSAPSRVFRSRTWHVSSFVVGQCAAILVGVVWFAAGDIGHWLIPAMLVVMSGLAFGIVQAARFFTEWNAVAEFLRGRTTGRDA